MTTVIVTGTSSGIGHACALHYLNKGYHVLGISRNNSIEHENFRFLHCDLSDPYQIEQIHFSDNISRHGNVILINNAGIIGEINRVPTLDMNHFLEVAHVNIVAPQVLSAKILQELGDRVEVIVNISSGAAKRAIPSWAAYCASKSAIDIFSETLRIELLEMGQTTRIYSVAPGVVDTPMQEQIRSANESDFTPLPNFLALKENNELRSPQEVAQRLDDLIQHPEQGEVVVRL
jgi:benzil reductase ((S)-benzoin forming)